MGIGLTERGDHAIAAAFGGAEVYEKDLIISVVDDAAKQLAAANQVGRGELALEDGKLEVIAEIAHGLEDLAQALVVGDIVADQIGGAHLAFIHDSDAWNPAGRPSAQNRKQPHRAAWL